MTQTKYGVLNDFEKNTAFSRKRLIAATIICELFLLDFEKLIIIYFWHNKTHLKEINYCQ